jgi:hypothetical protein
MSLEVHYPKSFFNGGGLDMIVANANNRTLDGALKFGGHETFPFRYGWLKKAVDRVEADPKVFIKDSAIVDFGVGKNMVRSIKYWGLATLMLIEDKCGIRVSNMGKDLLQNWDPYLEDPASLWLIHWLISTNQSRAAVWYLAFNRYPRPDFTKIQLLDFCINVANQYNTKPSYNTIKRDIDCFIRTYLPVSISNTQIEETFSCPLNEISLINPLRDGESYQFNIGPKYTLPKEVVGYALLNFILLAQNNRKTISISDCLYRDGSPGQVFKLDENSLLEYVEELTDFTAGAIEIDDTAGLKQIYSKKYFAPQDLLSSYYA